MENLFEMGANFDDGWTADNKDKSSKKSSTDIKAPEKHQLYFAKEKRRGKVVTIVKPFYLEKSNLQALLKVLKKKLGTGGTVKEDSLEFQGDIPEKIRTHLKVLNYRFK
ncbi:MAG: Translation initiation factor SUI1 [uncultured Sulfurovum sp.]|uniref:Translation initiation factor SUI1 n=1 Tax=uncultured Sulfurovum sp. TaxID=269237 RepID=A0A6S6SUW4_9BACT|nr:MAG: Translation initiation factor SUI1 [uncultured Sulfurovum sp.]